MVKRVKDYSVYEVSTCGDCGGSYSWRRGRQSVLDPGRNRCAICRRPPRAGRKRKNKKSTTCIDCAEPIYRGGKRCKPCSVLFRYPEVTGTCPCGSIIQKTSTRCLPCHNREQDLGKSRERAKFQNSVKWKKVRSAAFARDDYQCQICFITDVNLNAHHMKRYIVYPELRLDVNNLLTVCEECHYDIHRKD